MMEKRKLRVLLRLLDDDWTATAVDFNIEAHATTIPVCVAWFCRAVRDYKDQPFPTEYPIPPECNVVLDYAAKWAHRQELQTAYVRAWFDQAWILHPQDVRELTEVSEWVDIEFRIR